MQTQSTPIDKSKWPDGPWKNEPDRIEWEYCGLPCLMVRIPMGNWCGYAGVFPGHPWHGIGYSECVKKCPTVEPAPLNPIFGKVAPKTIQNWHMNRKHFACENKCEIDHTPEHIIDIHGGLTYSGFCRGHICHTPKPGQPDNVFWFGFDCAHAGDVIPKYFESGNFFTEHYCDAQYVKSEVERLADQLIAVR